MFWWYCLEQLKASLIVLTKGCVSVGALFWFSSELYVGPRFLTACGFGSAQGRIWALEREKKKEKEEKEKKDKEGKEKRGKEAMSKAAATSGSSGGSGTSGVVEDVSGLSDEALATAAAEAAREAKERSAAAKAVGAELERRTGRIDSLEVHIHCSHQEHHRHLITGSVLCATNHMPPQASLEAEAVAGAALKAAKAEAAASLKDLLEQLKETDPDAYDRHTLAQPTPCACLNTSCSLRGPNLNLFFFNVWIFVVNTETKEHLLARACAAYAEAAPKAFIVGAQRPLRLREQNADPKRRMLTFRYGDLGSDPQRPNGQGLAGAADAPSQDAAVAEAIAAAAQAVKGGADIYFPARFVQSLIFVGKRGDGPPLSCGCNFARISANYKHHHTPTLQPRRTPPYLQHYTFHRHCLQYTTTSTTTTSNNHSNINHFHRIPSYPRQQHDNHGTPPPDNVAPTSPNQHNRFARRPSAPPPKPPRRPPSPTPWSRLRLALSPPLPPLPPPGPRSTLLRPWWRRQGRKQGGPMGAALPPAVAAVLLLRLLLVLWRRRRRRVCRGRRWRRSRRSHAVQRQRVERESAGWLRFINTALFVRVYFFVFGCACAGSHARDGEYTWCCCLCADEAYVPPESRIVQRLHMIQPRTFLSPFPANLRWATAAPHQTPHAACEKKKKTTLGAGNNRFAVEEELLEWQAFSTLFGW